MEAPIHSLPPELLASIFYFAIPSVDSIVRLSLVCRHWRDVAFSSPNLWHYIYWNTFNSPHRNEYALQQLVLYHGAFVSEIKIVFSAFDGLQPHHDLRGHFNLPLSRHPETLLFRWDPLAWSFTLAHLPNLTHLTLSLNDVDRIQPRYRLRANYFLSQLSRACPLLESLSLGDRIFQPNGPDLLIDTFQPDPFSPRLMTQWGPTLPLLELVLPRFGHLTRLRFVGSDVSCATEALDRVYQPRLFRLLARAIGSRLREFATYRSGLEGTMHAIGLEEGEEWREFCEGCDGVEVWQFGLCESLTDKDLEVWGNTKKEKLRKVMFWKEEDEEREGRGGWTFGSTGLSAALKGCPKLSELEIWMATGTEWQASITDSLLSTFPNLLPNLTTLILYNHRTANPTPPPLTLTTLASLTTLPNLHTLALSSCPHLSPTEILSFLRSRQAHNTTHESAFTLRVRDTAQDPPHRLLMVHGLAFDTEWIDWIQDPDVNLLEFNVAIDFRFGAIHEPRSLEDDRLVRQIKKVYGEMVTLRQTIRASRRGEPECMLAEVVFQVFYGEVKPEEPELEEKEIDFWW